MRELRDIGRGARNARGSQDRNPRDRLSNKTLKQVARDARAGRPRVSPAASGVTRSASSAAEANLLRERLDLRRAEGALVNADVVEEPLEVIAGRCSIPLYADEERIGRLGHQR